MQKQSIKKLINQVLILAISLVFFIFFTLLDSKAEIVQYFPQCESTYCFQNPLSAAIAKDGSFVLLVDSSSQPFVKKVNYSNGDFSNSTIIPLNISNPNSAPLQVSLNGLSSIAFIYKAFEQNTKSSITLVNLTNSTTKSITSPYANNEDIGAIGILDTEGTRIIASNKNSHAPRVFIVNTNTDSIERTIEVNDLVNGIQISPDFKKATFTYSGIQSQLLTIYDIATGGMKDLEMPSSLFFSIDAFLSTNCYDLEGDLQLIGSLGGNHVLHALNLKKQTLGIDVLDSASQGASYPAIYPDGSTAIVAGIISGQNSGYTLYKINLNNMRTLVTKTTRDGSNFIDMKLFPDQNKVYVLAKKGGATYIEIFRTSDFSIITEYQVSRSTSSRLDYISPLLIDPLGRYAIRPDAIASSNNSSPISSSSSTSSSSSGSISSTCPSGQHQYSTTQYRWDGTRWVLSSQTNGILCCPSGQIYEEPAVNGTFTGQTQSGSCQNIIPTANCGNGAVDPGEECETTNGIVYSASCNSCRLICSRGTKQCNYNSNCTPGPINSNAAGTGPYCGCYCNFVQVRKVE